MKQELPIGIFIEKMLGFSGLFEIIDELSKTIGAEELENEFNDEAYVYPVSKEDYDILKNDLVEAIREIEGINVSFLDGMVSFDEFFRIPRSVLIDSLYHKNLASNMRDYYRGLKISFSRKYSIYPITKDTFILHNRGSDYYKCKLVKGQKEMIMDMEEKLFVVAYENIINWFIREFMKKEFENYDKCLLLGIEIEEIDYKPDEAETAEEVDELEISFRATIQLDDEVKDYKVKTVNWLEKERTEI